MRKRAPADRKVIAGLAAAPRRLRITSRGLLLGAALPLLAACGSARRGEPIAGPLPLAEPALERGRAVFIENCQRCHPGGEGGLGPALNDKPLPGFVTRLQVRRGLGAMPSFSDGEISDEELEDLVEYLGALRRHGRGRGRRVREPRARARPGRWSAPLRVWQPPCGDAVEDEPFAERLASRAQLL